MSYGDSSREFTDGIVTICKLIAKIPILTTVGVKNGVLFIARSLRNLTVMVIDGVRNVALKEQLKREQKECEDCEKVADLVRIAELNLSRAHNLKKKEINVVDKELYIEQSITSLKRLLDALTLQERKLVFPSTIRAEIQELATIDIYDSNINLQEIFERVKNLNSEIEMLEAETIATIQALRGEEYTQETTELNVTAEEIVRLADELVTLFTNYERSLGCHWVENFGREEKISIASQSEYMVAETNKVVEDIKTKTKV